MTTIIYVSTCGNKLAAVEVDENGNLDSILQLIEPVVDVPDNVPKKGPMNSPPAVTEWISRHPKLPILYSLTSFWNEAEAIISTFRVNEDGTLTKLGSRSTGGHQAAQGVFSPDASTYAIAHHNGGKLSLFDVTKSEQLNEPVMVMDMPEIVPGTRKEPKAGSINQGLPALHGLYYSPNGKYLVCADPVQNAVFTYSVDSKGLPTTPDNVISQVVCHTDVRPYATTQKLLAWLFGSGPRPRRAVVHPSGKYLYVMHEWTNYVQIYAIDEEGRVDPNLVRELSCVDPSLRKGCVGCAMTGVSELEAADDALIVSVRGTSACGGRAECSVRMFAYKDGGRDLECIGTLDGVPASVRHFYRKDNVLWVGINSSKMPLVQKYEKQGEEWILKGEANVDMDVFCITPKDV
mmetsp:Transcript_12959/g.27989  ORF Transcript_12959/g.27989 Transcript_12959/m.27989 type:complete len:405 (-) Transcript_12959:15-1229(-)